MRRSILRATTLAIAAAGVVGIHGCSERLEGGNACPILCPDQNVELREIVVAGVVLDTVLSSYPPVGQEPQLVLVSRGDTLETRIIVRYDTLPTTYRPPNSPTDTPIELVQGAGVKLRLQFLEDYEDKYDPNQSLTIEAYDVDTTVAEGGAADTAAVTMLPLFRPDRFLGSVTFTRAEITATTDSSLKVPVNDAYLLAKIQAKARLRVGFLVRAAESAELVVLGNDAGRADSLVFTVSTDPAVTWGATPYSATPTERFIASTLTDFVIVAQRRAPDTPAEVLTVGGIPGRRSYLRFELPSNIVDSTSVVRATLLLTQYPNRLAAHGPDTISLYPQPVVASDLVTDLHQAANLLGGLVGFRLDSLRRMPSDSGDVSLEVIGLIQVWRLVDAEQSSRALVLRLPTEGTYQDELYFYSTEAAAALRPRLRIVYVPRVGFGLP
jgi:hypothetical protein